MAITQLQSPDAYTPASNAQRWVASSTQTAQPNFAYTVIITDNVSSTPQIYQIPPNPVTGQLVFDGQPFVERFLEHFIPINLYGWQRATGVRQITVNIGETYGSPAAYHAGANASYKVWNAVEDYLRFPDYDLDDYVYDARTQKFTYLSSNLNCFTYTNKSDYFYALTSQVGDILKLRVETFNSAGASIGEYDITNPHQGSANYRDKYLCIDIGYKGLLNIPALQVTVITGTYPIITASVASYTVSDISISVTPAQSNVTLLKTVTVGCEPKFDVYTFHYLRKNGAFEPIHFTKRSEETISTDKSTYKKIPFVHTTGVSAYTRSTGVDQQLDASTQKRLKLRTNWLSPAAIAVHQELIDSPYIYLDDSSTYGYPRMNCLKSSYKITKRSDGLANLEVEFEYAHQNHRQRG